MGRGGPGGASAPAGPSGPPRPTDSGLGLNDLRAFTRAASHAHANFGARPQQPESRPPPPAPRRRPGLATTPFHQPPQLHYRPPREIGYHEITPTPSSGSLALYILLLEPSVATSHRRCSTFMILEYPYRDNCLNTHISCNEENQQWRVRTVQTNKGTPRTQVNSLLTMDFVAFVDESRRDSLHEVLTRGIHPSFQTPYFNSQSWAQICLFALQENRTISPEDYHRSQKTLAASLQVPFFSYTPNTIV